MTKQSSECGRSNAMKCAFCSTPAMTTSASPKSGAPSNRSSLLGWKVGLRLARWMRQRHEHLAAAQLLAAHIVLDGAVAATESMLLLEPLKEELGRVPLLDWPRLVLRQDRFDHAQPWIQPGTLDRLLALIPRRHRIPQHLPNRITRNPKLSCYRSLTSPIHQNCTSYAPIDIHEIHPSGVPRTLPQKANVRKTKIRRWSIFALALILQRSNLARYPSIYLGARKRCIFFPTTWESPPPKHLPICHVLSAMPSISKSRARAMLEAITPTPDGSSTGAMSGTCSEESTSLHPHSCE